MRTLSERHQLLQALHTMQDTRFSDKAVADEAISYSSDDNISSISEYVSRFCEFCDPTKVMFRGIAYMTGMHVCVKKLDNGDYYLCSIKYIIVNKDYNDIFFIGNRVQVYPDKSKGVCEITEHSGEPELVGCHYRDLLSHEPVMHFITPNTNIFAFKAAPFELL